MDRVSVADRSRMMAAVKGKDTKPEVQVRSLLHAAGLRFRLHRKDLPGRPDIVLPRHRVAVFVHGCFWHGHDCGRGKKPSSNAGFWAEKIDGNTARDRRNEVALTEAGWRVAVIWQCRLRAETEAIVEELVSAGATARES